MNRTPSARVITVFDNYLLPNFDILYLVAAEQELQSTECLEWKDRILRELIQLIYSCQEVQRAAELHKRQRHQ